MDDFDKKILISIEKNRMMIGKAARELFCHRNTVAYRLRKIKKETGIDPLEVRGLVALLDRIGGQD